MTAAAAAASAAPGARGAHERRSRAGAASAARAARPTATLTAALAGRQRRLRQRLRGRRRRRRRDRALRPHRDDQPAPARCTPTAAAGRSARAPRAAARAAGSSCVGSVIDNKRPAHRQGRRRRRRRLLRRRRRRRRRPGRLPGHGAQGDGHAQRHRRHVRRQEHAACFGHGALSPDFKGADGVVTQTAARASSTSTTSTAAELFVDSDGPLTEPLRRPGRHFAGPAADDGGSDPQRQHVRRERPERAQRARVQHRRDLHRPRRAAARHGPETITFDKPISTATINIGQGSGGTATLTAFRGTRSSARPSAPRPPTLAPLTVNGEHITKLTLSFTGSAIVFDDLRWNTEPIANGDVVQRRPRTARSTEACWRTTATPTATR